MAGNIGGYAMPPTNIVTAITIACGVGLSLHLSVFCCSKEEKFYIFTFWFFFFFQDAAEC